MADLIPRLQIIQMNKILTFFLIGFCSIQVEAFEYKSISIFFGYLDQTPSDIVLDGQKSDELISTLTFPCLDEKSKLCGFIEKQQNPTKLQKDNLIITIYSSSISSSNQYNLQSNEQKIKSLLTMQAFIQALQIEQFVIYAGHSRFGGGPDFSIPHLNKNEDIDKDYYQSKTPGLNLILNSIKNSKLLKLALLSCDSKNHFETQIHKANPKLFLDLAQDLIYPDDLVEKIINEIK